MSVEVTLTWQELVFAATIGLRRRIESMRIQNRERHGANRKTAAEQWYYNIVGATGECAVAKSLNRYWPAEINQGKEKPDIFPDIQVRTLECHHYDLIVRDDDHDEFRYVLATGEPPTFMIHGWAWGYEARNHEWRKDRGNRNEPCFWMPQKFLHSIEELMAETPVLPF